MSLGLDLDAIERRNATRLAASPDPRPGILISVDRFHGETSEGVISSISHSGDGTFYAYGDEGESVFDDGNGNVVITVLDPSARDDIEDLVAEVRRLRRGR